MAYSLAGDWGGHFDKFSDRQVGIFFERMEIV